MLASGDRVRPSGERSGRENFNFYLLECITYAKIIDKIIQISQSYFPESNETKSTFVKPALQGNL